MNCLCVLFVVLLILLCCVRVCLLFPVYNVLVVFVCVIVSCCVRARLFCYCLLFVPPLRLDCLPALPYCCSSFCVFC